MKHLGLSMQLVKAIFVSHEHSDHIQGIPVLAKKYGLPVYITESTLVHGGLALDKEQVISFRADEPVRIGGLTITAFTKLHDAADPHSFIVSNDEVTIGVFTDIGLPCEQVIRYFQLCHAAFLETNYDEDMLERGSYPYHLKKRIRGGKGHLSNRQALELFLANRPPYMTHLFLSHLSQDNNNPGLVQELFEEHAAGTMIVVASRHAETEVYAIHPPTAEEMIRNEERIRLAHIAWNEQKARLASLNEQAAMNGDAGANLPTRPGAGKRTANRKHGTRGKKAPDPGEPVQISLF